MPHFHTVAFGAFVLNATVFGSLFPADADERHIMLTGSSTVAPLAAELARSYEADHPGDRIDVQTGGSTRGVTDARGGLADIGMISRSLKDDESDLQSRTIALDGICIILNAQNPVQALTNEEIVAIFTGKITDWAGVGGGPGPITVVNKAEGRSTLELFLEHFALKAPDIKPQVVIGDNSQGIKTVAGNPGSIGYVSIGAAEFEAEFGTPIKLLGLDGVEASIENVRNRSYPLSRPLNFVTAKEPQGLAAEFIAFARTPAATTIIEEQFFVPLAP